MRQITPELFDQYWQGRDRCECPMASYLVGHAQKLEDIVGC
jgi:hypothetical protein